MYLCLTQLGLWAGLIPGHANLLPCLADKFIGVLSFTIHHVSVLCDYMAIKLLQILLQMTHVTSYVKSVVVSIWWSMGCLCEFYVYSIPDSKVHGANMGPIWGRQDPDGTHVGPMNFVIWDVSTYLFQCCICKRIYIGLRCYRIRLYCMKPFSRKHVIWNGSTQYSWCLIL